MAAVNTIVYDDSTLLASKLLQISNTRQQIISNNLANASTPGYIRKELDFQKSLSEQINSGDIRNVESVKGEVIDDMTEAPRVDGNNVTVATELNQLMQNSVMSNLMAKAYTTKMNIIRNSIKNGG